MARPRPLSLVAFAIVLTVGLGELGIRLFVELPLDDVDERTACYRHDSQLGWFPREQSDCVHQAFYDTSIRHNRDGFRDRDHDGARGLGSIAVLGDSFVWGYDVERECRFTEIMQESLPGWSIYNLGVSGYGTDQEYLLLQQWFPRYEPEIVILVVHSNDSADNSTNYRYHHFKPYFELEDGQLALRGVPVPISYRYRLVQHPILLRSHFARGLVVLSGHLAGPRPVEVPDLKLELINAVDQYLLEHGSELRLVFTYGGSNPHEQDLLEALNIPYLRVPEAERFKEYGQHWTPAGHRLVAARILEQLHRDGVIPGEDRDTYVERY